MKTTVLKLISFVLRAVGLALLDIEWRMWCARKGNGVLSRFTLLTLSLPIVAVGVWLLDIEWNIWSTIEEED